MSKYTHQVNLKLSPELDGRLREVADFLGIKVSEVLRTWTREKVLEYQANKTFQAWLEKKEGGR